MSAIVTKVHMLILMEPDIAAAVSFYQGLGLKLVFHLKDKWAEMQLGELKLGLCPTQEPSADYVRQTGIVLQVAHLYKVYEEHRDTIHFLGEPKEAVHGIMVSFKDPGNNILDLYQPTPEKVAAIVKEAACEEVSEAESKKDSGCCKGKGSCR